MINQQTVNAEQKKKIQEEIDKTHKRGVQTVLKIAELTRILKALEVANRKRWAELKVLRLKDTHTDYTMYDTVTVNTVPSNPTAVAGYVGGWWPTFSALAKRFPRAKHLSIAVNSHEDADCLDIENGDASPEAAGTWAKRQKSLGKKLVVLYFSVSNKQAVERSITASGIKRSEVKFWGAHYTFVPHKESGFDAIQWTDKALGRNLDASLCNWNFLVA